MKTRKLLSVLLAAILVITALSVVGLTVSADATEISTAEQLAAITSGDYKLTQDITLTGTISSFTGTLDGNGHTVTVSAPMFDSLAGTVENLTIKGDGITSEATSNVGVLANKIAGDLTVKNVTNKVNLTAANASAVGGFIGNASASEATAVIMTNCVNDGNISAKANVGGFIGSVSNSSSDTTVYTTVTITDSVNNGDVTMSTADGGNGAGGFIGFNGNLSEINVSRCVNNGDISATGGDYGIAGFLGCGTWDRNYQKAYFSYCANYGSVSITDNTKRGRVAGIVGRWNRRALELVIDSCYNMGTIQGGGAGNNDGATGILAYTNNNDKGDTNAVEVKNCYNAGTIQTVSGTTYAMGFVDSQNASFTSSSNNYYVTGTAANAGNNLTATAVADKAALNKAVTAIGYVVDPTMNDGYAVLAWQCSHSDSTVDCIGTKCNICGVQVDENGSGEHDYGEWTNVKDATVTTDGSEKRICGSCLAEDTRTVDATGKITPVGGVYNVENENQMLWLAYNMNSGAVARDANVTLKADITLTNGMTFIDKSYAGTFDGEGHTLAGLNYTIFNALDGTVKNIVLKGDIDYTGITDVNRMRKAATIAFEGTGMTVENVVSYVNIKSSAADLNAGAIIGYASGSCTFTKVTYAGNYSMEWTGSGGGLGAMFGWGNAGGGTTTLTDCAFTGTITISGEAPDGTLRVGAVAGFGGNGTYNLTGCTNNGTVTYNITDANVVNGIYAGGIIGRIENNFTLTDCVVAGTSTKDGKTNYGAFMGYSNTAGGTIKHSVTFILETETSDNGVVSNYIGSGEKNHNYVDCYGAEAIEDLGESVTVGGVVYQAYNFGYLNAATKAMENFKFSQGTITKVDDTNYTIGSYDLSAFISTRLSAKAGYNDIRLIIAADRAGLDRYQSLALSIVFTKDGETVKTVTKDVAKELVAYKSAVAAGSTYTAANGSVLFGIVITDVPTGAWDTVTLSLNDENGSLVAGGQQTSAEVSTAEVIASSNYNIENHHADLNYHATWVLYVWKGDIIQGLEDKTMKVEVVMNGATYTVKDWTYFGGKDEVTGEYTQGYIRLDLETAGMSFMKGDILSGYVKFYDSNGNYIYSTGVHTFESLKYTTDYPVVELPENTYAKQPVTSCDDDLTNWGDSPTQNFFDGNTTGTKIGGTTTTNQVTVTFSLANAKTLLYYTLVTGGDTAINPGRNPSGWTLYGKVGEEWVVLSEVGEKTGLKAVNSTAFSYKIDNPQLCKDYKIVFATGGAFQMNELELYASPTVDLPTTAAKLSPSGFSSEEIPNDGSEGLAKLFDGSTNSKVCYNVSAKATFTVSFTLAKATKLTHYTLITANDTAGSSDRNPKGWILYGKVGDEWVVLSEVTATGLEAKNFTPYTYEVKNPQVCQEYKIEFTRNGNLFQMSELQLYSTDLVKQTVTEFSSTAVGNDGAEGLAKLFDNDTTGTKVFSGGTGTVTIEFTLAEKATLTYYALTTGSDTASYSSRNPKSWVLYGVDGDTLVELSSVSEGGLQAVNSTTFMFAVDNPQAFQKYQIVFTKDNGFQMSDLSVYIETETEE